METTTELYQRPQTLYLPAELHDGCVFAAVEIQLTEETVFDVVEHVSMHSVRRTLTLQFENNHTTVMA